MIYYLNQNDERFIGVYTMMISLGKNGKRFRRSRGIYLWWEILFDIISDEKVKKIAELAFHEFKRLCLKERYYYGIWLV